MINVSIFAIVAQIRQATDWLSSGEQERHGLAVRVVAMAKRLKIVLADGSTVLWAMSQGRVDQVAKLFTYDTTYVYA